MSYVTKQGVLVPYFPDSTDNFIVCQPLFLPASGWKQFLGQCSSQFRQYMLRVQVTILLGPCFHQHILAPVRCIIELELEWNFTKRLPTRHQCASRYLIIIFSCHKLLSTIRRVLWSLWGFSASWNHSTNISRRCNTRSQLESYVRVLHPTTCLWPLESLCILKMSTRWWTNFAYVFIFVVFAIRFFFFCKC